MPGSGVSRFSADMSTKITIWGVRGGFPAAQRQFMEYGGNTTCISLEHPGGTVCFDAGTGLTCLLGSRRALRRLDILISHVHLDHILGLCSLSGLRGVPVHLYGEARQGLSFRERLARWENAGCIFAREPLRGQPAGGHRAGHTLYREE